MTRGFGLSGKWDKFKNRTSTKARGRWKGRKGELEDLACLANGLNPLKHLKNTPLHSLHYLVQSPTTNRFPKIQHIWKMDLGILRNSPETPEEYASSFITLFDSISTTNKIQHTWKTIVGVL
ncbi:9275_t:CDS:1 [Paraglomus occultum]|uniref:9275_t:CDS:1 n=1 Tax=Paraglomus occultum TaxID=144539 RepID=A0A9N9ACY2_9GLOM|nr:9275_t:CDS:1 [Paraglomus occultum]